MQFKNRHDLTSTEKIYWFMRFLVETDKGAFCKKTKNFQELSNALSAAICSSREFDEETQVNVLKNIVSHIIINASKEGTKQYYKLLALNEELLSLINSINDFKNFLFCINEVMLPSNQALDTVPTTEASKIAESYAKSVLIEKGTAGLSNILKEWDSITLDICLNKERDIAANLFRQVRQKIEQEIYFQESQEAKERLPEATEDTPTESDIVLSALVQEFERRLGQLRKQRSGQDLEDATSFIFDYYQIPGAEKPSHFTASIEVDNWTKDKKGWYLGFSLKRTLRERWKQTLIDKDTLTQFKIRHIIHLICNDGDLTESKIAEMGAQRHLFFVADNSEVLVQVRDDSVLSEYVKPMSELIDFLKSA